MQPKGDRILGLDLGTNSLGWALLEVDSEGIPNRIIDLGVRIFPAGVEGDLASGRDEPRNLARRMKRLARRQLLRRQRRRRGVLRHLQSGGLVPRDVPPRAAEIDRYVRSLDERLSRHAGIEPARRALLPYLLRQQALDRELTPDELARVLYHLGQRRGFKSNRKDVPKPDEKPGEVQSGIQELEGRIGSSGARTIGEWFATIDPRLVPLRRRWTSRAMYEAEFELIRQRQAPHYPSLLPGWWERLKRILFHQRPLRSQGGLVGRCPLEPTRRRTALAMPIAQRFRILQTVNHMRIVQDHESRPLDPDQRSALLAALETSENLTIAQARRAVGLGRSDAMLSVEIGDEKKLPGDRTGAAIAKAAGITWSAMPDSDRTRLLNDLLSFEDETALATRLQNAYGFTPDSAAKVAKIKLEPGRARHSDRALRRLVPLMEKGLSYGEARKRSYPESFRGGEALDHLPPLRGSRKLRRSAAPGMEDLRNPVVERSLTELRKVVNAVIRTHGKPDRVHVELARDLKRGRKDRMALNKAMRKRGDEREVAAESLRRLGCNPTRDLIDRVLLAHECSDLEDLGQLAWESQFRCPYTGKQFGMRDLIEGRVDVEHIIPFSRSLDDSFANKTLCDPQFNRLRKGNRTPFECLSSSPEEYEAVLERVRRFRGDSSRKKFRLFSITEIDQGFAERQLQDTRYASRLSADYLRLLYGLEGASSVVTVSGPITAMLRRQWGLNAVLSGAGGKDRSDHRHHAIDAVVIAACTRSIIKRVSDAAARSEMVRGRDLLLDLRPPWDGMVGSVTERVDAVVVSHRANRRVNGALHDETNYGPPARRRGEATSSPQAHVRKPVAMLKASEIEKIVDPAVRSAVSSWVAQHGHGSLSKLDLDRPDQFPAMQAKDGRRIPIKRVRIRQSVSTVRVGEGPSARFVSPNSNHHMSVFEVPGKRTGATTWKGVVCTRLEAMRRISAGRAVVDRTPPPGGRFLFTLAAGDSIEFWPDENTRRIGVVSSVSESLVEWRDVVDGRPSMEIRRAGAAGGRLQKSLAGLRDLNVRRLAVLPSGRVDAAGD